MYLLLSRGLILHKLSKIVLSGKFTYGSRETELLAKAAQDKCLRVEYVFTNYSPCYEREITGMLAHIMAILSNQLGCDHVRVRTRQQPRLVRYSLLPKHQWHPTRI